MRVATGRRGGAIHWWRRSASAALAALVVLTQLLSAPIAAATTPQTITFALPSSDVAGSTLDLDASATSGLPVSFVTQTPATCTVGGTVLTLVAAGVCTVTASQAGDATWSAAPSLHRSMFVTAAPPPPVFDPQPQTITFALPASGYVGATIALSGTASSGLEVSYASLTPAICLTDGTTLALDAVGTCTVTASQAGNQDDWLPAPDVARSIEVRLSPFVTNDGANLGRYALNGPIQSMVIDPATGITYVGGSFSEIGIRSGSVALVNGPSSGTDSLKAGSPDVLGSELKTFPHTASSYFVTGRVRSVNGDGVMRDVVTRMTTAGTVDGSWHLGTTCGTAALPDWARNRVDWDLGDVLVANINMVPTTTGDSTIGLTFIDKATGIARRTGAGDATCGAGSRMWPATPVFAPLASCATWLICFANVVDVVKAPGSNSLLVAATVNRGQTIATQERQQTWLMAYDLTTGARRWAKRLEATTVPAGIGSNATWGASLRHMVGLAGSVLISGNFPLEAVLRPTAEITNTMLLDAATGTILQRWNQQGEQDLTDPLGSESSAASACKPVDDSLLYEQWRFVSRSATHAVGYGRPVVAGDATRSYAVCDYSVSGTGLAARLTATSLGTLAATPSPDLLQPLPSAVIDGHILVGPFDAFDLDSGNQLNWHASPSSGMVSLAVAGSTVVIAGEATFLKGIRAYHVAAFDADLNPVVGFDSGLWTPDPSLDWYRGLALNGDQLVVLGRLLGPGGASHMIALDKATGAVEWTAPSTDNTYPLSLTVDPASGTVYVGMDSNNERLLRRYVRAGNGFTEDLSFAPTFGTLTPLNGPPQAAISSVAWIAGRLYVGGQFSSVNGVARQGLARYGTNGVLDGWAPKLITEMAVPAGAPIEIGAHSFLEVGANVVVTGRFNWYEPGDGGAATHGPPVVRAYNAGTGALVRPLGDDSWFGSTDGDYGYGLATVDGVVFAALGNSGVAAFDASTLNYLPFLSVRTFAGWGSNAIYAIAARADAPAPVAAAGQVAGAASTLGSPDMASAAAATPTSLVFGGNVPTWENHSASNVLALGLGALSSDHTAPTASAVSQRPRTSGAIVAYAAPWTVAWSATDTGGSGVSRYELSQSRNGASWTVVNVNLKTAAASVGVLPGYTYRFRVRPVDRAGNVGVWAYGATFKVTAISQANAAVRYTGTWTSVTSPTWWGGTAKSSSKAGSTAQFTFTGKSIAWVALMGLGRGKASVYIDGTLKATIDLNSLPRTLKQRVVWSASYSSSATRTILIKVQGTTSRPRVDVDGFLVGT